MRRMAESTAPVRIKDNCSHGYERQRLAGDRFDCIDPSRDLSSGGAESPTDRKRFPLHPLDSARPIPARYDVVHLDSGT